MSNRGPCWMQVIDEALVTTHLGTAELSDSYEEAKRKLGELIAWHVAVATDPRVNGGWQLVPTQETDDMADKGAQAIASWDDGCTWPESWGADAERHRRDSRKAYRAMLEAAPNPGQEE